MDRTLSLPPDVKNIITTVPDPIIRQKSHIKSIVVYNSPLKSKQPYRLQLLKVKAERLIAEKKLKNKLLALKQKSVLQQRQRLKRSPYRLFNEGEKEYDNYLTKNPIKSMAQMESLVLTKPKTPIQTLTRALTNLVRTIDPPRNGKIEPWGNSYKKLLNLNNSLKDQYQRRSYRRRMLDFVTNSKGSFQSNKRRVSDEFRHLLPEKGLPKLFKNALSLADTIHQHTNSTKFTFLSPKFGSIVKQDKYASNRFLSPNILPFYKDDSAILPIPEVLEATGMSKDDENAVMELVMEASGANNMVQDIVRILNETDIATFAPDIDGVSNIILNAFQKFSKGLHPRQKRQLKQRHYTFIKAEQLREFVGKNGSVLVGSFALYLMDILGLYNTSDYPIDIDDYSTWSEVKKKRVVMNAIRAIAAAPNDFDVENMVNYHLNPSLKEKHRRYKRQGIELELEADVLSPYMFAPLYQEPQILGPIILSPGIFSPPVMSPAVLSPCILSPQFMSPLIFSPYILSPNILSASAFLPYILSPYCLSPNILQPYLFTPLILSPHIMCPDIMSPTLLSGIILNPFAFSPAVKTTSFLAIEVLSPSAFSKK
uniref:Uncharacterized protein n=1 Tax=Panagrolaimus superbus TaxID=310955 RepID=A0A914Z7B0_9BILA